MSSQPVEIPSFRFDASQGFAEVNHHFLRVARQEKVGLKVLGKVVEIGDPKNIVDETHEVITSETGHDTHPTLF